MKTNKLIYNIVYYIVIALIVVVFVYPFWWMATNSLNNINEIFGRPTLLPKSWMWSNYVETFRRMDLLNGFKNSSIVALGTILMILVVGIPAAYALSKLNFRIKKEVYYIVLLSQMFAPIVVVIPLYQLMMKWNLINSLFSLILMNVTFNLAFIVLLLKTTFDSIPKDTVEAAMIDGCNKFSIMTKIVTPISSIGIAVAVIFAFTRTWNEFLFAFTFISSSSKKTVIVKLYEILKNNPATGIPWELVMAGSVLTTVPLVILFICIKDYITGDATKGAVK